MQRISKFSASFATSPLRNLTKLTLVICVGWQWLKPFPGLKFPCWEIVNILCLAGEQQGRNNVSVQRWPLDLKDTPRQVIDFPRFPCGWSAAMTLGSSYGSLSQKLVTPGEGQGACSQGHGYSSRSLCIRTGSGHSFWVSFLSAWPQFSVEHSQWCSVLTSAFLFCLTQLRSISVAYNSKHRCIEWHDLICSLSFQSQLSLVYGVVVF